MILLPIHKDNIAILGQRLAQPIGDKQSTCFATQDDDLCSNDLASLDSLAQPKWRMMSDTANQESDELAVRVRMAGLTPYGTSLGSAPGSRCSLRAPYFLASGRQQRQQDKGSPRHTI